MRARAARVRLWLESVPCSPVSDAELAGRVREFTAPGFRSFDALHVVSAEASGADVLCTCDDGLLAAAKRHVSEMRVRVMNPVELVREVL
jgi:hypothetical protein